MTELPVAFDTEKTGSPEGTGEVQKSNNVIMISFCYPITYCDFNFKNSFRLSKAKQKMEWNSVQLYLFF